MMRHLSRVAVLLFTMALAGSGRAEAGGLWDWLEELNGPGPSTGWNLLYNVRCSGKDGLPANARPDAVPEKLSGRFAVPKYSNANASCLFVDYRDLHAAEDPRFYPVDVRITEVGTSAWVHSAVEIGAGVGWMHFSSRNPMTSEDFSGNRLTISFPRIVFRPFLAIPAAKFRDARWGFFQMYFKETIVVGNVNQGDFASKPGTIFDRSNQRVESVGFMIDLRALVETIRR